MMASGGHGHAGFVGNDNQGILVGINYGPVNHHSTSDGAQHILAEQARRSAKAEEKKLEEKKAEDKRAQEEQRRLEQKALQSLAFPEMNMRHNDVNDQAPKTCAWLLDHKHYIKWLHQRHGLLWIKGNPGTGKSTLLKYALRKSDRRSSVDHDQPVMKKLRPSAAVPVIFSFFFHGRGFQIQKSSVGLFRSLLHQVLSNFPNLLSEFSSGFNTRIESQGEFGEKWDWHEGELRNYLEKLLPRASTIRPIRIYVDALDEAGEQVARELVAFFQRLTSELAPVEATLSICFSCRHYPIVDSNNGLIILVEKENECDIVTYVHGELQRRLPASGSTSKAQEIAEIVISRASNVFQWVVIVLSIGINLHAAGKNMNAIRKKLQDLPTELHSLYQEILGSIATEDLSQSLKLMQWICFARRPLSLTELRFAMAVDTEPRFHSFQDMEENSMEYAETNEDMERRVKSLSGGLAEVVSQGQTGQAILGISGDSGTRNLDLGQQSYIRGRRVAQFIHQSVNDYLLQSGLQKLDNCSVDSVTGRGHLRLSRACIAYLAMEEVLSYENLLYDERRGEFRYKERDVLNPYTSTPLFPSSAMVRPKDSFSTGSLWDQTASNIWDRTPTDVSDVRPYESFYEDDSAVESQDVLPWESLTPPRWGSMAYELQEKRRLEDIESSLSAAIVTSDDPLTILPTPRTEEVSNAVANTCLSFLPYAVTNWVWHAEMVEAQQIPQGDLLALLHGPSSRIVSAWLQHYKQINTQHDADQCEGTTLLHVASKSGLLSVVRAFVDSGNDFDLDQMDSFNRTPLLYAVTKGYETIVQMLLKTGNVDVNTKDAGDWTPLISAAANGHESIVQRLLDLGVVQEDFRDKWGRTALSWGVSQGHVSVVQRLLKTSKVDVDSRDSYGRTPFSFAAEYGHESILRLLLGTGKVNINSRDTENRTALSWAAEKGFGRVVKLLLDIDGLEIDVKDSQGRTPLSWAAEKNSEAVVHLLLNSGKVDVDPKDSRGRTPLAWAAEKGSMSSLLRLLGTGKVDLCSKGKDGWEPRARANLHGHMAVEQLLVEKIEERNSHSPSPF